jgi:hypothetical protein
MGGFFIDSIIRSIAKSVRGERRVENALAWPIIDGKISILSQGIEPGNRIRPRLVFSYEIVGETFYGGSVGAPIEPKLFNRVNDAINRIETVHVRYDPFDPGSSRLLNGDNPEIPFEIDHTAN